MAKCGKGCMPECKYFTTGGCVSPFNCPYKVENESITTATSTPCNLYPLETDKDKEIARLQAENAELRERLDKAVDKTIVSEMLAKYFDCPCNFSPLDEEMWAYCRDNCVDDNIECWIRVINKKCAELKGEKK